MGAAVKIISNYVQVVPEDTDLLLIQRGNAYFTIKVSEIVKASATGLSGHGPPEGVVYAKAGCTYVDLDDGTFYWKATEDGNTGWRP